MLWRATVSYWCAVAAACLRTIVAWHDAAEECLWYWLDALFPWAVSVAALTCPIWLTYLRVKGKWAAIAANVIVLWTVAEGRDRPPPRIRYVVMATVAFVIAVAWNLLPQTLYARQIGTILLSVVSLLARRWAVAKGLF